MNHQERSEFDAWLSAMVRKCGSEFERNVLRASEHHMWAQWVEQNMKHGYHGPSYAEAPGGAS